MQRCLCGSEKLHKVSDEEFLCLQCTSLWASDGGDYREVGGVSTNVSAQELRMLLLFRDMRESPSNVLLWYIAGLQDSQRKAKATMPELADGIEQQIARVSNVLIRL